MGPFKGPRPPDPATLADPFPLEVYIYIITTRALRARAQERFIHHPRPS